MRDGGDDDRTSFNVLHTYINFTLIHTPAPPPPALAVGLVMISVYKGTEEGIHYLSRICNGWWSCGLNPGGLIQNHGSLLTPLGGLHSPSLSLCSPSFSLIDSTFGSGETAQRKLFY